MDGNGETYVLWTPDMDDEAYEIIEEDPSEDDIIEDTRTEDQNYEDVQVLSETEVEEENQHYYIGENIIEVPQESFIYLTEDGPVVASDSTAHSNVGVGMSHLIEQRVEEAENKIIGDQDEEYTETIEEVINEEDWVQSQECVTVGNEQIVATDSLADDDNIPVPLPIDQDEYTTSRPYPCDFCSRRFRKKANLINHMVAHQNDRPHTCQFCKARYIRRHDLLNHLKFHAYAPDDDDHHGSYQETPMDHSNLESFLDSDTDEIEETTHNYVPKYRKSNPPPAKKKSQKSSTTTSAKQSKYKKTTATKTTPKSSVPAASTSKREYQPPLEDRYPITDPRKPFVCQHCGVGFTRQKALESHARLHENETHDCPICNETFYDENSLSDHMRQKHNQGLRNKNSTKSIYLEDFDVDDSNSDFDPNKIQEDDEEEDDDEDMGDDHYCNICDSTFKTIDQLKRHVKVHEVKQEFRDDLDEQFEGNSAKPYCKVCGKTFSEALDLLAHAEIHAHLQQFKCDLCLDTYLDEEKLKSHLLSSHLSQMTENSCRLCGKRCLDQKSLIKHSWEHSREKSHSCSKCGKTFHNKARLKRHIVSHKKKSAVCEICNETFPDGRSLMNHKHLHTKSNQQFPCFECGKTFGSRSSQQIHIRIHTGERPYSCRFCWKSFCDGGTLRKHERIHTGEKPYACLVCPRAFNQRVVLREHIRSHHSAPDPKNGTRENPYYCSLCGELFSVSSDLIVHLIHHSDESTASKRTPIVGPRKYKRRRKLKPNEIPPVNEYTEMPMEENSSHEDADHSGDFHGFPAQIIKQEKLDPSLNLNVTELEIPDNTYTNEKKLTNPENLIIPENILDSFSGTTRAGRSQYESKKPSTSVSSSGRPKMIHTQKTKIQLPDGKRKTKTLVTKQVKRSSNGQTRETEKPVRESTRSTRHSLRSNREPDVKEEYLEGNDPCVDILDEKYSDRFDKDIVHDLQEILRSPVKQKSPREELPTRRSKRQTKSKLEEIPSKIQTIIEQRQESDDYDDDSYNERVIIKQEVVDANEDLCGICGVSFESRQKLVDHISVHI